MNIDCGEIQLKEASVILTKYDDQVLSQPSPRKITILDSNACSIIKGDNENDEMVHNDSLPSKRKRQRKNTTPKRISRTVSNFYDYGNDNTTSEILGPCEPVEGEETSDIVTSTTRSFPYFHEFIPNCPSGNNNASISNKHVEDMENERRKVITPKLSTTPIFVKRTKTATPGANQPISTSAKIKEDAAVHSAPSTRNDTGKDSRGLNRSNRNVVTDKHVKRKTKRNVPNILSRTKKLSSKAQKYKCRTGKREPSSPVEIRPKTVEGMNLTTATRAALENTLSKQIVSSANSRNPNVTFPVLHKKPTSQQPLSTFEKKESAETHSRSQSPKKKDPPLNVDINNIKSSGMSSSFIPLTVNPFPSNSAGQSEVKPNISKPQYRSRLRSKSGTKYIVRKDRVISADLSDMFQPSPDKSPNSRSVQHIFLKLPENSLNERKFYDNFVKPPNVEDTNACTANKANDEMQGCSGLQGSSREYILKEQKSPILKLTHSNNDVNVLCHSPPVRLFSQGGLDDVKREMNIENPNTWNVHEDLEDGIKQSLSGNLSRIATPTDRFLSNLQARFMPRKSRSKMLEQQGIVQTFCLPFNWNECNKIDFNSTFQDFNNQPLKQTKTVTGKQTDCKLMAKGVREDDYEILVTKNSNTTRVKIKQEPVDMPSILEGDSGHQHRDIRQIRNSDANCRNRQYRAIKQEIMDFSELKKDEKPTLKCTHKCIKPKDTIQEQKPYIKKEFTDITVLGLDTNDEHEEYCGGVDGKSIKMEFVKGNETRRTCTKSDDIKHGTQNINVMEQTSNNEYARDVNSKGVANGIFKEKYNGIKISKDDYCNTFDPTGIHNISVKMEATEFFEVEDEKRQSASRVKEKQSLNDHAYTRPDIDDMSTHIKEEKDASNVAPTTVVDLQNIEDNDCNTSVPSTQNTNQKPVLSSMPSIPVYAIRCGEKVVLFPASKAVNKGKTTNVEIRPSTPIKTPNEIPKSGSTKKQPIYKRHKPDKKKTKFAEKCELTCSNEPKTKKSEVNVSDLVSVNYNSIVNKRPKNQLKHMCAVIVQVTRREDNTFSFTKDILALSFTNGSNPFLVRWHNDGIHVAMVTFNTRGNIQHLTVDSITPGFYCLTLKNDSKVRKNRTFEGLLTSTLPNENLLLTERDFIAIGEIKSIMDPTISKPDVRNDTGLTVTEALSDILPSELNQVYNPTISDRSYRPKVDDKIWYSAEKFETFTSIYGRTRGFQPNGSRLPGEENV